MSARCISLALAFFSLSLGAAEHSVIMIDEAHMQIGKEREGPAYSVAPSTALVVDFTAYHFSLWPDPTEPQPDTVGVAVSDARQYYFAIPPGTRRLVLDASNARPLHGSEPWRGIASGERAILTIGKLRIDNARSEEVLRVHWLGLVDAQ